MSIPRIDRIAVEGYLSIRAATIELGPLNVLVGANGSGKSNFVSALELLSRIVDQRMAGYIGLRGEPLHSSSREDRLPSRSG
ncbi:MAG: AAA family ATPase [Pseudonocardiaceae bacterium]